MYKKFKLNFLKNLMNKKRIHEFRVKSDWANVSKSIPS